MEEVNVSKENEIFIITMDVIEECLEKSVDKAEFEECEAC